MSSKSYGDDGRIGRGCGSSEKRKWRYIYDDGNIVGVVVSQLDAFEGSKAIIGSLPKM